METESSGVTVSALTVEVADDLRAWDRVSADYDLLCLLTARPDPFGCTSFLRAYTEESEFFPDATERELRLYSVRQHDVLLGHVALRRTRVRVGPVPTPREPRVDFLVTHDHDAPRIIARAADEERVTRAVLAHLIAEPGWRLIELRAQRPDSAIARIAHQLAEGRNDIRVRTIPIAPYCEVPLPWTSIEGYFRALSKRMRSNVSRQVRRLYASGCVELLIGDGPGVAALLPAFLDLEQRSWKAGTDAALGRSAARIRFFERLAAGSAGLEPSIVGVVHDGVLIAALICGRFGTTMWAYEMTFDNTYADLGPGQLLLLLAAHTATGHGVRSLQFFQNFGYYKHRWLADDVQVCNVQIVRTRSFHGARAWIGDRRHASSEAVGEPLVDEAADEDRELANPAKRDSTVALRDAEWAERSRRVLATGLHSAAGTRLLSEAEAMAVLPFPIKAAS